MAITSINITQNNISGRCNLLSVHNPLVFLCDVVYTLAKPNVLFVELQDSESNILATFQAIEIAEDNTTGTVSYMFEANDILSAFMDDIDDFYSQLNVIEFVENITKDFTLRFYIGAVEDSISFTAIHAAQQFGDENAAIDIFNNTNLIFYGQKNDVIYVYFYNNSENNILYFDRTADQDSVYIDYDETPFIGNDGGVFRGL